MVVRENPDKKKKIAEEILNVKLLFLCSVSVSKIYIQDKMTIFSDWIIFRTVVNLQLLNKITKSVNIVYLRTNYKRTK